MAWLDSGGCATAETPKNRDIFVWARQRQKGDIELNNEGDVGDDQRRGRVGDGSEMGVSSHNQPRWTNLAKKYREYRSTPFETGTGSSPSFPRLFLSSSTKLSARTG